MGITKLLRIPREGQAGVNSVPEGSTETRLAN